MVDERDELQKQYGRLSGKKTGALALVSISATLFISNLLAVNEPTNSTLGAISLSGVIGGGIWFQQLRSELKRNLRRSLEIDARRGRQSHEA